MDYGMTQGLNNGLMQFMGAYQDSRKMAFDEAMKKRQYSMELAAKGLQENPDTGSLEPTEETKLARQVQNEKNKQALAGFDPNSAYSQKYSALAGGLLKSAAPNFDPSLVQGLPAAELKDEGGLIGKAIAGGYGTQGRQIVAERMGERNAVMREGMNLRKTGQASTASDKIHNDAIIKQKTQQLDLTQRGYELLNKPGLTNQEFNDVQQELSNAIAGAKSSALGKLERTEYETFEQKFNELKQRISGKPQDAVPPEILERVKSLADDLNKSLITQRAERAKMIGSKQWKSNPEAQEEQKRAVETYTAPAEGLIKKASPGPVHTPESLNKLSDAELLKLYNEKMGKK